MLLVVDTSGSMERLADCECETPACDECLPDCGRGQRNRWADTLEALPGPITREAVLAQLRATKSYDAGGFFGKI